MDSKFVYASILALGSTFAGAQTSQVVVNGTAGSVAAQPGGSGTWYGLGGSAATAKIGYSTPSGFGPPSASGPMEPKFASSGDSGLIGRTFTGVAGSVPGGTFAAGGSSTVTAPGASDVPTYYTADWSEKDTSTGTTSTDSGTFDPWDVHVSDLNGFGATANLYFQTGLRQNGLFGTTGFGVGPTGSGRYGLDVYIVENGNRVNLFGFDVFSNGTISTRFTAPATFSVYRLGANANSNLVSPTGRFITTDASLVFDNASLLASIVSGINPNGSLNRDLQFGIVRSNYVVPTGGNPDDVLFGWHSDTTSVTQAVPEPAAFAPLGLGALAVLRRRRRAH